MEDCEFRYRCLKQAVADRIRYSKDRFHTNSELRKRIEPRLKIIKKIYKKIEFLKMLDIIEKNNLRFAITDPQIIHCESVVKKLAEEGVQMKELQRNIIRQIAHTETILMHWGRQKEQRKFLRWFQIPENLRTILATLPKFPKKRIAFRFDTCYVWLCKYIDTRNPSLYDNTNNLVVHIENDPLREVFQIDLFHHCQVAALLKKFLIPI